MRPDSYGLSDAPDAEIVDEESAALWAWYDHHIRTLPPDQKRLYRQFHRNARILLGYEKPDETAKKVGG